MNPFVHGFMVGVISFVFTWGRPIGWSFLSCFCIDVCTFLAFDAGYKMGRRHERTEKKYE